jgi:hypothetical protein
MLDPQTRLLYLEELRPPDGYRLDRAIAATFSLDLLSLLMAPLSMVFSEQRDKDELLKDPIAFLEALQRAKDRLAIFCQAGRIAVPTVDSRLYSYLEPIVLEVQPPGDGIFHPKVWVLRFVKDNNPICYRLICLSRNLTFDRSWDTILTLEGFLDNRRQRGFSLNRPLADFIQTLPALSVGEVPALVQEHVNQIVDEIRRVQFQPPPGFDKVTAFRPSGIASPKKQPTLRGHYRLLVMSPFLTDSWLRNLVGNGAKNVLISRPESLDAVNPKLMARLETNTEIFIMDEAAERPDDEETQLETLDDAAMGDLSGLHAKLYISEQGWQANVLTGSANATTPGFNGTNVEFMVELTGKRSYVGIDKFLGQEDDHSTSLRSMLRPYRRSDATLTPEETIRRQLEESLENARHAISTAGLSLTVLPETDNTFNLELRAVKSFDFGDNAIEGRCAPISLNFSTAQEIGPLLTGQKVTFPNISLVGLTGFFAFELTSRAEGQQASIRFVLNLPVTDMPAERDTHILYDIISDRGRFIRYLLFLLAEGTGFSLGELTSTVGSSGEGSGSSAYQLPLLEELVRAFSRQPEKIDRIAALVEDLKQTETGYALLPEEFDQIWDAFQANRSEGDSQ